MTSKSRLLAVDSKGEGKGGKRWAEKGLAACDGQQRLWRRLWESERQSLRISRYAGRVDWWGSEGEEREKGEEEETVEGRWVVRMTAEHSL
jgi:hypothetical protein